MLKIARSRGQQYQPDTPLKIYISSFWRRPESSVFKGLDTGLRGCDEFLEMSYIH